MKRNIPSKKPLKITSVATNSVNQTAKETKDNKINNEEYKQHLINQNLELNSPLNQIKLQFNKFGWQVGFVSAIIGIYSFGYSQGSNSNPSDTELIKKATHYKNESLTLKNDNDTLKKQITTLISEKKLLQSLIEEKERKITEVTGTLESEKQIRDSINASNTSVASSPSSMKQEEEINKYESKTFLSNKIYVSVELV